MTAFSFTLDGTRQRTNPITMAAGSFARIRFSPALPKNASAFLVLNADTPEESSERILNVSNHHPVGGFMVNETASVEIVGQSYPGDQPTIVTGFLETL